MKIKSLFVLLPIILVSCGQGKIYSGEEKVTSTISSLSSPAFSTTTSTLMPSPTELKITPTATISATSTLLLTTSTTATSTITPFPPLSEKGPYLAYIKDKTLNILSQNGQGKRIINLPKNGYVPNFGEAISPDGKWMVIYLGTPSGFRGISISPELSINLLYIPDGSVHIITRIFPENTDELLYLGDYGDLMSYDWSPDGHYLGFAGAMDSQKTELYVYGIDTKTIRRLTNDSVNIWRIDWSPEGQWIWFESVENIPPGGLNSYFVVKFDNKIVYEPALLFKALWTSGEWISPKYYFLHSTTDGGDCPVWYFSYFNVEKLEEIILWRRLSNSYALDANNQLLAVSTYCGEQGTFIVDWNGTVYIKVTDTPLGLAPWSGGIFSFLGYDYSEKKVYGIDRFGAITLLSYKSFTDVIVSPDNNWYLLYQDPQYSYSDIAGMDLFSGDNKYIKSITDQFAHPVAWTPGSIGLFYMYTYSMNGLYYIAIPNGQPTLLDDCLPNGCNEPFVWLP